MAQRPARVSDGIFCGALARLLAVAGPASREDRIGRAGALVAETDAGRH